MKSKGRLGTVKSKSGGTPLGYKASPEASWVETAMVLLCHRKKADNKCVEGGEGDLRGLCPP